MKFLQKIFSFILFFYSSSVFALHFEVVQRQGKVFQKKGTAFSIGNNQFVSAAHVFKLNLKHQETDFYLRAEEGSLFKITQITRFSQEKDLIQFEVDSSQRFEFLESTQGTPQETVFALNHTGILKSMDAKALRFTAPVAPGMSGGPLLNKKGQVLGVIVQGSENNRDNLAVPMNVLENLPRDRAEFQNPLVKESLFGKTLESTWKDSFPLPAALPVLSQKAQNSYLNFTQNLKDLLKIKFQNELFPKAASAQFYLKNQTFFPYLGHIVLDTSQNFIHYIPEYKKTLKHSVSIAIGETAFFTFIPKEKSETLAAFLINPRKHLDIFAKASGLTLPETVLQSPPRFNSDFQDSLQRRWMKSRWWTHSSNESSITLYCLPHPQGVACLLTLLPTTIDSLMDQSFQNEFEFYTLSYQGSREEWEEFFQIDALLKKEVIPKIFRSTVIQKKVLTNAHKKKGDFLVNVGFDVNQIPLQQKVFGLE